jgi:hypothetical protein
MRKLFCVLPVVIIGIFLSKNGWAQKPPPPPPPPKVSLNKFTPPVIAAKDKETDAFYKRNPSVANIFRQGNKMTLTLKNGRKEEYDLGKKNEKKNFTDKYGSLPIPPPPTPRPPLPPPPPPKPTEKS